ncbi:MAG: hypothetical protein IPK80_27895 [Nannocystis sp.]|nr:hypothetical protein [Nannocystis sp.]MBK8264635.1 hypothetical protein [Nannocystis sp.]MBK8265139.1 hypothetical protein [Nannocystis sp.]
MTSELTEVKKSVSEDDLEIQIQIEDDEENTEGLGVGREENEAVAGIAGEVIVVIPRHVQVMMDRRADDGALCIRIAVGGLR